MSGLFNLFKSSNKSNFETQTQTQTQTQNPVSKQEIDKDVTNLLELDKQVQKQDKGKGKEKELNQNLLKMLEYILKHYHIDMDKYNIAHKLYYSSFNKSRLYDISDSSKTLFKFEMYSYINEKNILGDIHIYHSHIYTINDNDKIEKLDDVQNKWKCCVCHKDTNM